MAEMAATNPEPQRSSPAAEEILLKAEGITKVFPGTVALDQVDFNVYRGKVNVLIGENGAGKSTLMKILAGVEKPTRGRLLLDGKLISPNSPRDAARYGIGIIYQEMNLFPNLNVSENIFMAREKMRDGIMIDIQAQDQITRSLMKRLEQSIDPHILVGKLRLGQQQIVEIAKALEEEVRILIMDEPTSALSKTEVAVLFRIIRELKQQGVSIIYISHKLDELLEIGDTVTILRDGHLMAEAQVKNINIGWIIEKMVGRNPAEAAEPHTKKSSVEVLRVESLTLARFGGGYTLDHVSFSVQRGEIVGIYGLMGAGRTELLECLMGLYPAARGKIWLDGRALEGNAIVERIRLGMVLVPEDRQAEGLVPTLSVADNMILSSLSRYLKGFYLSRQKERKSVREMIRDLSLKVADPNQIITSLSGGNQQKVVVARGLMTTPKVLLMDEPTRGIDVGAKADMFEIMSRLANQGLGILFVSSELKEVLAMADRILVMAKGRITGEFKHGEATESALVAASSVLGPPPQTAPQKGGEHESD
jgi:erythritol transport system ATP-binding protein